MKSYLKVNDNRILEMQAGARELEQWLLDLMRQGLVILDQVQEEYWEEIASRMVNAKLGSLARRIRNLKQWTDEKAEWHEITFREACYLYLVAKGLQKIDQQPEDLQCELLRIGGVHVNTSSLEQEQGIVDTWLIIGQEFGHDEKLNYRRLWIYGEKSREVGLLLDFSWNNDRFFPDYEFGALYKGELIFYPGATPLRGLLKEAVPHKGTFEGKGGINSITQLTFFYAKALARNPYLEYYPYLLNNMRIDRINNRFSIIDTEGQGLPLNEHKESNWKLLALSMDQPLSVFGLWNGFHFSPSSVFALNRLIQL